jgi:hypothetical protein
VSAVSLTYRSHRVESRSRVAGCPSNSSDSPQEALGPSGALGATRSRDSPQEALETREIRRRRHSCGGRPRPAGCRFPGSMCLRFASGSISVTWYTPLVGVSHRHKGRGVLDFGDQGPYPSGPVGHIRIRAAIAESRQRPVLCSCGLVGRHCASGPGMVGSQARYYSSYTRTPHFHLTGPHTPTPTRHT